MKIFSFVFFSAVVFSIKLYAQDVLSFDQLWGSVLKNNPNVRAASEEAQASQIESDRAARHWYPRVYASGRVFSTNDPATNFVFKLEQRRVGLLDFVPNSLNEPGSNFYQQGALGIDLPIFEGGGRFFQASALKMRSQSKNWELKAQVISEYARIVQAYAGMLALIEERKQLTELLSSVQLVLDHYSIGSKSNPVGYSGLLGLKNLKNRIEGLVLQNQSLFEFKRSEIESVAIDLPKMWVPASARVHDFLRKWFDEKNENLRDKNTPAAVEAARLGAESFAEAKNGEKARFLPRLGAFAQGDLFHGDRASATSYVAGAYLQWDLFSATNFGAVSEAEHRSSAALARVQALEMKMRNDQIASRQTAMTTEKTLKLLDESASLLSEQTQTARSLFRNGSINALQFVEVLNRRADLLSNRREAELMLAQTKAALYVTTAGGL